MRRLLIAALAIGALLGAPATASADGDPASDILLAQDVYYPYQPAPSPPLAKTLTTLLATTKRKGYPLKVAVIDTPQDLGAVPTMYGRPQEYAHFLSSEIAFNSRTPLLVVMPAGFGVAVAPRPQAAAVTHVPPPSGGGTDALVRSGIAATVALARAAGHPVAMPKIPASGGAGGSSGPSPALVFGAPVALLALVGLLSVLRRRSDERERAEVGPSA